MNKNTLVFLFLLLAVTLYAEVCWDNGTPLYEGNFIYQSYSVVTDNNDIFICWTEVDAELRKFKLQKTDFQGNLLWADPITIEESNEFMIERNLVSSQAGAFFAQVYLHAQENNVLYKIDNNGSILWSIEYNPEYYEEFRSLENGGALNLRITSIESTYYLAGTCIDGQGNVIWDDLALTPLPEPVQDYPFLCTQFIDDQLRVLINLNGSIYFMKFDEDGNPLFTSPAYSTQNSTTCKFMNDNFYVIFNDTDNDELKMWIFDINGNSASGTEPIIITSLGDYYYHYLLAGDDYFHCLSSLQNNGLKLLKCDFQGNISSEIIIDTANSNNLKVYDQEQDFISLTNTHNNGYENYILELSAAGVSDPIFYLPENIQAISLDDKYYLNNGYTITGKIGSDHESISTIRKSDNVSSWQEIRLVENDYTQPTLVKRDDELFAHWFSHSRNSTMTQIIDDSGETLLDVNGETLININNCNYYYYWNDVYYFFDINDHIDLPDTVSIAAYDFAGNPLWSNSGEFIINDGYHNHIGITPFYNGLLFHIATDMGSWVYSEMQAMYFDENGLIWNEPVTLDFGFVETYRAYRFNDNYLFHESNNNVYAVKINEDGSCDDQFQIAVSSELESVYGLDNRCLVKTKPSAGEEYALYYLQDGISIWDTPLYYANNQYYNLTPFFDDEYFYLTGNNVADSMQVHQFDYDKNFIQNNSFGFALYNPNVYRIRTFRVNGLFVFFTSSSNPDYDRYFSYTVYNHQGQQLIAEFDELLMDRPNIESINDIVFDDNCFYLDLSTGIKVVEGEYERNHYIQKVDISSVVPTHDNEICSNKIYSLQNYPNPFNPCTTICFELAQSSSKAIIEIFNVKGQKIKSIDCCNSTEYSSHTLKQSITWNGLDDSNRPVGSGIYFYQLLIDGSKKEVNKCLLIK